MDRKKANFKALFPCALEGEVSVCHTEGGRVLVTDRYAIWDLSALSAAGGAFSGIELPGPGVYRAMARELRYQRGDALSVVSGEAVAGLFDDRSAGAGERLVLSEWVNGMGHRPLIHHGTAALRLIDGGYTRLPDLAGNGEVWEARDGWTRNTACVAGLYTRVVYGCVQLATAYNVPREGEPDDALPHYLCRALAIDSGEIPLDTVKQRYPYLSAEK